MPAEFKEFLTKAHDLVTSERTDEEIIAARKAFVVDAVSSRHVEVHYERVKWVCKTAGKPAAEYARALGNAKRMAEHLINILNQNSVYPARSLILYGHYRDAIEALQKMQLWAEAPMGSPGAPVSKSKGGRPRGR